jgi:hypothetical protein
MNSQGWRLIAEGAWIDRFRISSILSFGTGSDLKALTLFLSLIALRRSMANSFFELNAYLTLN